MKKLFALALTLTAAFTLAACDTDNGDEAETIRIGYVAWEDGITQAHAIKVLLEEEMGYEVELVQADAGPVFQDLANGNLDFMPHSWLPHTHSQYADQFSDDWEEYSPNYEGARIGLVVPDYVTIDSIAELNDSVADFSEYDDIVGIEGGAGIMAAANNALEDYDLDMDLLTSSEVAMVSTLGSAIDDEEWVVVTGWVPHFKFSQYDLKFLDDPEGTFGAAEDIVPVGRTGLTDEHPDVVELLNNIYFTDEDFGNLIGAFNDADEDDSEYDAAFSWYESYDVWEDWIPSE